MCWLTRLQIALFVVATVGMLVLVFAHWTTGWASIAYFAWGMVISVGGFLLNLIVSGAAAIFQPRLRKMSIWVAAISIVMLLGLAVLWKVA